MSSWLNADDPLMLPLRGISTAGNHSFPHEDVNSAQMNPRGVVRESQRRSGDVRPEALKQDTADAQMPPQPLSAQPQIRRNDDDSSNESDDDDNSPAGTIKTPPCASYGRYYCSYKEDYPLKVVTEVNILLTYFSH